MFAGKILACEVLARETHGTLYIVRKASLTTRLASMAKGLLKILPQTAEAVGGTRAILKTTS